MSLKALAKTLLVGKPGLRPRSIRVGLLSGLKFNVDTKSKSMRLLALDEREICGHTRRLARGAASALDIGSADGWYSVYFASLPGVRRILSFDGSAGRLEQLRANLALNGLEGRVEIHNKFVAERDEGEMVSIDRVAADLPEPILMKIDVDGAEMQVFRGAEQTLRKRDCRIVLETHSVELERECKAFLEELGYRTQIIGNGWYRAFVPERRNIPHNRWLIAERA